MSDKKNAETLLALSDIDLSILRLQKQLDELPQKQQIIEVRHKNRELATKVEQVNKLAADAARTLKLLTDETAHNEDQIVQAQASLDKSSEYRETTSLAAEMDMLAGRKNKLEEDSLIQLEKQEKIAAVQAQVASAVGMLEAQEQAYTDEYRKAGGSLKQKISDLEHARTALVSSLPAELARRYTKALENKNGIGAAQLSGNQCSGCHSTLSEGQIAKLQEGLQVGECPNCNRPIVT